MPVQFLNALASLLHLPVPALIAALLLIGKATVLLAVAFAATRVMQRTSAVSRHHVWLAVLAAVLTIPVIAAISPIRLAILPQVLRTEPTVAPSPATRAPSDMPDALAAERQRIDQAVLASMRSGAPRVDERPSAIDNTLKPTHADTRSNAPWSTSAVVLATWALVSLALAAWLAFGQLMVFRIVRRAQSLAETAWDRPRFEIADRLGLEEAPHLVASADILMPFACGWRSPTIVLPHSSAAWSEEQRTAVLLHEMAHIKRRDIIGHTIGRFACAVYWFHPLVWSAAKRLRAESERACDDLALLCGARASDYAEQLLDIVSKVGRDTTPSLALAMATRSEFEGRMLAILDPSQPRVGPSRRQSWSLIAPVALSAVLLGVAVPASSEARIVARRGGIATSDTITTPTASANQTSTSRPMAPVSTQSPVAPQPPAAPQSPAAPIDGVALTALSTSLTNAAMSAAHTGISAAAKALVSIDQKSLEESLELSFRESARSFGAGTPRASTAPRDSSERPELLARILRTEPRPDLRRIAAWALNSFADATVSRDALADALRRDTSATVREMSAWSLSSSDMVPAVVAALANAARSDASGTVRSTSIWALAESGAPKTSEVISAITFSLSAPEATTRETAAWALGVLSPSKAPPALLAALTDREAPVREAAAWALHEIQDDGAVPALDAALRKETVKSVQLAELRALAAHGEAAISLLKKLITDDDPDVRGAAIRALAGGSLSDPWPRPRPRPRVRP